MSLFGNASEGVSNPPDANLYYWLHSMLVKCKNQRLPRLLLGVTFIFENFYVNKLKPGLGFHYNEKYFVDSWIVDSSLISLSSRILNIDC